MSHLAVIGLGIMGLPMARNLVAAGHVVVGYDHGDARMAALEEGGGRRAASIAEAVAGADVVITMLPDSPQVEEVVLGPGGVLEHATAGVIHIDMSSIRPDVAVRVAQECRARGLRPLDAPVSGGERGAIDGTLSIMLGGEDADVAEVRPLLEAVGRTIVHVGPNGSGQTVKAANQLIVGGTIQLVAEAIVFLEAYGVDTQAAVEVLAGGLAGNRILDLKAQGMLDREFAPGFRIDLHHKDLGIVTSAAREAGVAIPVGALVAQLMGSARANGDGGLDHSALLRGVERMSGRELR
ncbi:2-hydroxy-3-oxopropionate reductase [Cellulomonas timonensis]|uniref:2-hydroxy-3-oxopropionate reductase n=1 Tax=Cellulomonas timonensis TaxID=1689271 RepID=UPI00082DB1CE|nr:2-hydroxy-3-oxopropionate reductase [Cellulomonas timonensis]